MNEPVAEREDGPRVIDVRLIRLESGEWGISVEGHRLNRVTGVCPAAALRAVSEIVHTICDAENRSETEVLVEVLRDPEIVKRLRRAEDVRARKALELLFGVAPTPPADEADLVPEDRRA